MTSILSSRVYYVRQPSGKQEADIFVNIIMGFTDSLMDDVDFYTRSMSGYELAAILNVDEENCQEWAFGALQNMSNIKDNWSERDDSRLICKTSTPRSMGVGDIVETPSGRAYLCTQIGWLDIGDDLLREVKISSEKDT